MIQMKDLYKNDKTFQRIIHIKKIEKKRIFQNLIKEDLRLKLRDC